MPPCQCGCALFCAFKRLELCLKKAYGNTNLSWDVAESGSSRPEKNTYLDH